jgi:hypothetical protein
MKGVLPWLVCWTRHTGTRDFYPALAALVSSVKNNFFLAIHYSNLCVPASPNQPICLYAYVEACSRAGPPVSKCVSTVSPKKTTNMSLPAPCRQNDVIGEVLLRYKEASLWAPFISTNMTGGFNGFHEFLYEFQAIFRLRWRPFHHAADHTISLHFLVDWFCLC